MNELESPAPTSAPTPLDAGERQKEHYERIHDDYVAHYFDQWSAEYRDEFIFDPLLGALDLNGKAVADLACGSGQTSLALRQRFPDVEVEGFDVSELACRDYREALQRPATPTDLTKPLAETARFDAAIVIGGLHHCVADLDTTLANIAGMLRPGGVLLMCEPNRRSLLEPFRQLWYRMAPYFDADTEAALSHDAIAEQAGQHFEPNRVSYGGGPAYFLIQNSLITRVSHRSKARFAKGLMVAERVYSRLPGKLMYPFFVACWTRR